MNKYAWNGPSAKGKGGVKDAWNVSLPSGSKDTEANAR
jgi:hypothetical protein